MTVLAQSQNAIGFKYDVQVSNPQAAVAAIDKYRRVAAGSGDDVTVTLYQYLANGTNPTRRLKLWTQHWLPNRFLQNGLFSNQSLGAYPR